MHKHPALEPQTLGLSADPSDWTEAQAASFAAAVVVLDLPAEPTAAQQGLPVDRCSWTEAQVALNRAAKNAWFDGWGTRTPVGDVIVDASLEETDSGELVEGKNWGYVTPMLPTYSRRPNCARRTVAKIRARARSGLRGGTPAGRRSTSSASSSRSNPRRSADDPPGEHAPTPTDHDVAPEGVTYPFGPLAGRTRLLCDSARVGGLS
jgi:hypothetical protein